MFEFVEEALDAVAERVCGATDRSLNFAVGFGRDDRLSATALEVAAYGIAIVAFVGKHSFWCCGVVIDQVGIGCHVRRLAWGQAEANRKSLRICPGVDLGREATARTANMVAVNPPLPPAACWCARMAVLSIICMVLSEASLSLNAARMTSQTAASVQRRYCRNTEFQLPSSAGRSRQAQPVRVIHKTASSTRRWSDGRRPPRERFSVRNGAKNAHSSSVRRPRINAALRKEKR